MIHKIYKTPEEIKNHKKNLFKQYRGWHIYREFIMEFLQYRFEDGYKVLRWEIEHLVYYQRHGRTIRSYDDCERVAITGIFEEDKE